MRKCSVEGCGAKSRANGMCNIHYQRKINNIPMSGNPKPSLVERIMEKVSFQSSGCWMWTGAKSGGDGSERYKYGYINIDGSVKRVHRVLYEITTGECLDGLALLHRCDTPLCINPAHLTPGTHQDNMDDMNHKGRAKHAVGEGNHSKLSVEQVMEIKRMRGDGSTYTVIGERFNISSAHVSNIVKGKKWAYLLR